MEVIAGLHVRAGSKACTSRVNPMGDGGNNYGPNSDLRLQLLPAVLSVTRSSLDLLLCVASPALPAEIMPGPNSNSHAADECVPAPESPALGDHAAMAPRGALLWEPVICIRPRTACSLPVHDKNNLEEPNELGDLSAENMGSEDEGAQTASSPTASHRLRDLLTMKLLPAANKGILHTLYTSLFDPPQVPEGRARVFFEQGSWSVFPAPGSSTDAFIITVEGRPQGQEVAKVHSVSVFVWTHRKTRE